MSSIRYESGLNWKQKKEEFANEIRRQKRKEIISARRKILLEDFTKTVKKQPITQLTNLPYGQLIRLLKSGSHQQQTVLVEIRTKLSSPDQNTNYLTSKLVQSGKCSYLVQNLINRRFLHQTLSIISIIVSKPNPRHAQLLVNKGIIEILFELLAIQEFTGLVVNILGNICIQSDDYCEIILINNKQQDLIHVFNSLYEKFVNNQSVQNPQLKLKTILWMFGVVISTKQSTEDFETQYDSILYFCKDLISRRIFINEAIETVYELAVKNSSKVQQVLYTVINDLIQQQTGLSPCLQNLLYLIMKLTPGRFNYNKIFDFMPISEYKFTRQIVYIINKLENSEVLNQLKKNEGWWQKLLIKLNSGSQEFKITVTIIRRLKISSPPVWRFISDCIGDIYAKDVVLEILLLLKNQLYAASQSLSQSSIQLIKNLRQYNIPLSLQKIALKENYEYSSKAEQLLFLIENLSKQLKQQYEIDVEI